MYVLFTGALALAGAFAMSHQLAAELLNFGAFIAFMGVNAAAFTHYFLRGERKSWSTLLPPCSALSFACDRCNPRLPVS